MLLELINLAFGLVASQAAPTASKAFLGLGALAAGALLIFQEIDTALEVAGLFAAGQFAVRRLLFAEDRKKTASEIKCVVPLCSVQQLDGSSSY